jgi:hypothetical protein
MNLLSFRFVCVFVAIVSLFSSVQAQTAEQLKADLLGSWIVSVEGDSKKRVLTVSDVTTVDGKFELTAVYGYLGSNLEAVKAQYLISGVEKSIALKTPADTKITASQKSNDLYSGTFVSKSGNSKSVNLERTTNDLASQRVSKNKYRKSDVKVPGSDVPKECAWFFGYWEGEWRAGGYGIQRMWVVDVMPDCSLKTSGHSNSSDEITSHKFFTAKVVGGKFSYPCGPASDRGVCYFSQGSFGRMNAFADHGANSNNGSFKRVEKPETAGFLKD